MMLDVRVTSDLPPEQEVAVIDALLAPRRHTTWTEAERDVLRRMWRSYWPIEDVVAAVNAVAGQRRTHTQVRVYAASPQMKLRRPADFSALVNRRSCEVLRERAREFDAAGQPVSAPPPPPERAAPLHAALRDGGFSVAARIERGMLWHAGVAEASVNTVQIWGERNGAPWRPGMPREVWLARVNGRRRALDLPPYRLIAPRGPEGGLPATRIGGEA